MTSSQPRRVTDGLAAFRDRFDPASLPPANRPVFVMASGWRSGSTLLQRLLVSSGEILVWGEPYDRSMPIRRLAAMISPFDSSWPPHPYIVDPDQPPRPNEWIANAYPAPQDLLHAQRSFLDHLFAAPAHAAGYERWGVKAVRLAGEHAMFLQSIYPDARFVMLHRNPYDAFLSYRLLHEIRTHSYWWYHSWPDDQVSDPARFGTLWTELTRSFLEWGPEIGAGVVAYEDLIAGREFDTIERVAQVRLERKVLAERVGATGDQRGEWGEAQRQLTTTEKAALDRTVGALARRLGYVGPTGSSS